jgi:hypothetical protein
VARLPRLPRGPIVTPSTGEPGQAFTVYWQRFAEAIETQIQDISELLNTVILLNELITEAEEAIKALNTAAQEVTSSNELGTSYVEGITITADDAGVEASVTVSAHTRKYPQSDGSTTDVAVNGGVIAGLNHSTEYWIYYDQPSRAGGAVTYAVSASPTAQIGDRHNVGAVTTPAPLGSSTTGNGVKPPGYTGPG